jgi:hypothetical protein
MPRRKLLLQVHRNMLPCVNHGDGF